MLLLWSCNMYFLNCAANKDMFKLNLKYSISWLICLLRCIKIELNWIGIERKWIELELNWKILNPIGIGIELNWKIPNPTWIGIELNWKKLIDPSPDPKPSYSKSRSIGGMVLWMQLQFMMFWLTIVTLLLQISTIIGSTVKHLMEMNWVVKGANLW